jgi:hypothetical protein
MLAVSIELKERLGIPYAKVAGVLVLCFQFPVSPGALARAARRIARRAEATYDALLDHLRASPIVHADETGWYITNATRKAWLWVFATPEGLTLYAIRQSRGADVPTAILGDAFDGTLVVDGWVVYTTLGHTLAQCVAHLLRRCAELLEIKRGDDTQFAQQVKRLLQSALLLREARDTAEHVDDRAWERVVKNKERALARLLAPEQTDPDNERLRKHLVAHRKEILVFLKDPAVAPTNNLAEREVRPAVIVRKVSAGNRTDAGAHTHEILASLTRTANRGGVNFTGLVPDLLKAPEPVVLPSARFGLPSPVTPTRHEEPRHAPSSASRLRRQGRRARRVDHTNPSTAPP